MNKENEFNPMNKKDKVRDIDTVEGKYKISISSKDEIKKHKHTSK